MSRTKHSRVISALEKRALCFCNKGQRQADQDEVLFNEAVDKTGTVSTVGLADSENSEDDETVTGTTAVMATYLENEGIQGVSDDLLNVHAIVPGVKPEGVTRLIYENPDGINTRISRNEKSEKNKRIN